MGTEGKPNIDEVDIAKLRRDALVSARSVLKDGGSWTFPRALDATLSQVILPVARLAAAVEKASADSTSIISPIAQIETELASMAKRVGKWLAAAQSPINGYAGMLKPLFEGIRSISEEVQSEDFERFPYNWLGSLPASTVLTLYAEFKRGKLQDAETSLLASLRSQKTIGQISERVGQCQATAPAQHIIEDALWAHARGRYALSVPALLPQIEGSLRRHALASKLLIDLDRLPAKDGKRPGYAKFEAVVKLVFPDPSHLENFFIAFLAKRLFHRRNPILHGNDTDYGTEAMSAQCILALNEVVAACRAQYRKVG